MLHTQLIVQVQWAIAGIVTKNSVQREEKNKTVNVLKYFKTESKTRKVWN